MLAHVAEEGGGASLGRADDEEGGQAANAVRRLDTGAGVESGVRVLSSSGPSAMSIAMVDAGVEVLPRPAQASGVFEEFRMREDVLSGAQVVLLHLFI